jgi:hypothetical protein
MRPKGAHDRHTAAYVTAICLFQPLRANSAILGSMGPRRVLARGNFANEEASRR